MDDVIKTPQGIKKLIDIKFRGIRFIELNLEVIDALLDLNINNRNVSVQSLQAIYTSIQQVGYSNLIGLIGIRENGMLSDGQKRLNAIRRYMRENPDCKPVIQAVAFGVKDDEFSVTDNGEPRNARQTIQMIYGIEETKPITGAINFLKQPLMKCYKMTAISRKEFHEKYITPFMTRFPFPRINSMSANEDKARSREVPGCVVAAFIVLYHTGGEDVTQKAYDIYYNSNDMSEPLVRIRMATQIGDFKKIIGDRNIAFRKTLSALRGVWKGYSIKCLKAGSLGVKLDGVEF